MIPASPKLSAILRLARSGKIPLESAEAIVNAAVKDFGLADEHLDAFAAALTRLADDVLEEAAYSPTSVSART